MNESKHDFNLYNKKDKFSRNRKWSEQNLKRSNKNQDKKNNRVIGFDLILSEDSISEDGEVKDTIQQLIQHACGDNVVHFNATTGITIVDTDEDLGFLSNDIGALQSHFSEECFKNITRISISGYEYNLDNLGYTDVPDAYLSFDVIEHEFNILAPALGGKVADALNASLNTNIFVLKFDPITVLPYIEVFFDENHKDKYRDVELAVRIFQAANQVLAEFCRPC